MITCITGTQTKDNKCDIVAACVATMSATKFAHKTLVLQFYADHIGVEHYINNSVVAAAESFSSLDDRSIDALMRYASTGSVKESQFDVCTSQFLNNAHMLDVAQTSRKANMADTVTVQADTIKALLEKAKDVYDDVLIVVKWYNREARELLMSLADKLILCETQGYLYTADDIKGFIREGKTEDDIITAIPDYDSDSAFGLKFYKKSYQKKKVVGLPFNTDLNDSVVKGTVLSFIYNNQKVSDENLNFDYIDALSVLTGYVTGEEDVVEEKEAVTPAVKHLDMRMDENGTITSIEKDDVQEQTIGRGRKIRNIFFRKKNAEPDEEYN